MGEPITVGVLTGAGAAHLQNYLTALADIDEVTAVALADPSGQSVAVARKALGGKLVETFDSYADLLRRRKPTMALVTLEAATAPPVIDAALDAGCHVYAEKPACVRPADFAALVHKADSKHRLLMLALANRITPPIVEARRLIRSGKLGQVYGLDMHLIADQTRLKNPAYHRTWFASKDRAGGGHLIWLGIHWLDLAMYLTGARVTEVAGLTANVGRQPIDTEDSAAMVLRFDNGTLGTITSGYYLDRGKQSDLIVWGSKGWLDLDPYRTPPLRWSLDGREQAYDGPTQPSGYTPYVRACVRAAAGQQEPPISNADGLHVLQTVFACYRAAETGQTQKVEG